MKLESFNFYDFVENSVYDLFNKFSTSCLLIALVYFFYFRYIWKYLNLLHKNFWICNICYYILFQFKHKSIILKSPIIVIPSNPRETSMDFLYFELLVKDYNLTITCPNKNYSFFYCKETIPFQVKYFTLNKHS